MNHGRLKRMILHILRDKGPLHAYGIMKSFGEYTMNVYRPSTGALYPSLRSLLREGYIEEFIEGGRKIYRITDKGLVAISLDPPIHEHIKRFIGRDIPIKELWEVGEMIFRSWDSLDDEAKGRIKSLISEFHLKVKEVVEGA